MNLLQGVTSLLTALDADPQGRRLMRLSFPKGDGPDKLMLANTLVAEEAMSCDFRYDVEVLSDDALIPLTAVMGKMVTIALVRDDGSLRYFNGYVFDFRFVKTDGGFVFYQMILKPWLAFLRLCTDCRVFQNMNVTELCDQTFLNYLERDYKYCLKDGAPDLTLAVQYNESDHNHLHRRLEAAGLHYWYEHRKDGHTLCIGDDSTLAGSIHGSGEIEYQSQSGARENDGIRHWQPARRIAEGAVAINSYDFKNARGNRVEAPSLNRQGAVAPREVYRDTGAYGFRDDDDGELLARRQMEVFDAHGQDFTAESNERAIQPGHCFKMTGHFSGGCGAGGDAAPHNRAGREYLILSARHVARNNYHAGQQTASEYANTFTCVRKSIRWRAAIGTQSSDTRIYGVQTATVVGPAGAEIHTDKYGRVRLQFHWDRENGYDEKSSPWVRVMTGAAGSGFGQISLPRIGQEVVVQFLNGNCDRPLVIGSVYNAANMPPWELPANKTQSGILTRSSIGGRREHANALRFEDLKGSEEVWLHAEKDQRIEVEHDESHTVGNDRRKTIGRDETVEVKHDRTETVGNDEMITVHHNRTERVDHEEQIDIGGNRTKTVARNEKDSIGKNWSTWIAKTKTETVGVAYMQNVLAARVENVGLGYSLNVGGVLTTLVGADQIQRVGKSISISAGDQLSITVGQASLLMRKDGTVIINGSQLNFSASGPVKIFGKDVDVN